MQNIYSVAQVNSYIKNMFTQDFMLQSIFVKGEVSNCKYHSSGHIYFTLKDRKGTIACVMFAGNRNGLNFQLSEGQQVVVGGTIDVYERDGRYQLYAKAITLDGAGALYERFELLKRKLEEMGMFAAEYKQKIPFFVNKLGVVTAPTGAAVRDIINVATRRNPYIQIILYPAIVQGDEAPASVVNGIHALERQGVDAIIVGRGGGSIEDLWAFNEEIVAKAIFDCSVPIISAVGHETDTTIADYVADLRAPTPSAAAELAVKDVSALFMQMYTYRRQLTRALQNLVTGKGLLLQNYRTKLQYLNPVSKIREKRTAGLELENRLEHGMERVLEKKKHQFAMYVEMLKGLSPLGKLSSGYAYVASEDGSSIKSIHQIQKDDILKVHVTDGVIKTRVIEGHEVEYGK